MHAVTLHTDGSDCPMCGAHYTLARCRCAVNHDPVDCVPRAVKYVRADEPPEWLRDPDAVEAVARTFREGKIFCEADWTTLAEDALEAALVAVREAS